MRYFQICGQFWGQREGVIHWKWLHIYISIYLSIYLYKQIHSFGHTAELTYHPKVLFSTGILPTMYSMEQMKFSTTDTSKLDNLNNLKLLFKMLQSISLIVCIKKETKCVVIFPSQNDLNMALEVGVRQIYFIKLFINTLISPVS